MFALQLGRKDMISDVLNQFSLWPSIDSLHLKYLLFYHLNTLSHYEAIKNMIEICCLNYFSAEILQEMWNKVKELSTNNSAHTNIHQICANYPRVYKASQGEFLTLKLDIESSLKISLNFQKIITKFVNDDTTIQLESEEVEIRPGKGVIELSGVVLAQGKLKLDSLFGIFNNLLCAFEFSSSALVIKEPLKVVPFALKVPGLLIMGQSHPLAIELNS